MSGEERRRSVRVPGRLDLEYTADGLALQARINDISETGLFIDTRHPLSAGTAFSFKLDLPGPSAERPIQGRAKVVWIEPYVGVGVKFLDLSSQDRSRIRSFVASVLADR